MAEKNTRLTLSTNTHDRLGKGTVEAGYWENRNFDVFEIEGSDFVRIHWVGGWCVVRSMDALRLATLISTAARSQREKNKPLGWKLINLLNGEVREARDGASIRLLGDSFVIEDISGTQVGAALPMEEWQMEAITAAPAAD